MGHGASPFLLSRSLSFDLRSPIPDQRLAHCFLYLSLRDARQAMAPSPRKPRTPSTRRRRRCDSSRRSPSVLGRPKARGDGAARRGVPVPAIPERCPRGVEDDAIRRTRRCSRAPEPEGSTCRPRAAQSSALARPPKRTNAAARLDRIHDLFHDHREWAGDISDGMRRRGTSNDVVGWSRSRCARPVVEGDDARFCAIVRFCDGRQG